MKTSIAINQLNPLASQSAVNFKVMQETIAQNAADGSILSIFPEDFLHGVLRSRADLVKAGRQFDEWVIKFCDLARQYQIDIIPGTFPYYKNGNLYNSTVYINGLGHVITTYSKNNLWLSEREEYQPSLKPPDVFEGVLGKTAIIICWDLLDHTLFEAVVRQGVEWIIVLSFWSINQSKDLAMNRGVVRNHYTSFSDSKLIDTLVSARVAEYNIGVVFCNFAGTHEYISDTGPQVAISANRSQIVAPYFAFRANLRNRKEATLVYEVNSVEQAIKDFEINYGRRSDIISSYPRQQHQA